MPWTKATTEVSFTFTEKDLYRYGWVTQRKLMLGQLVTTLAAVCVAILAATSLIWLLHGTALWDKFGPTLELLIYIAAIFLSFRFFGRYCKQPLTREDGVIVMPKTVSISEDGVSEISGALASECDWAGIIDVRHEDGYTLMFADKTCVFAVPDDMFADTEQADAFFLNAKRLWTAANPKAAATARNANTDNEKKESEQHQPTDSIPATELPTELTFPRAEEDWIRYSKIARKPLTRAVIPLIAAAIAMSLLVLAGTISWLRFSFPSQFEQIVSGLYLPIFWGIVLFLFLKLFIRFSKLTPYDPQGYFLARKTVSISPNSFCESSAHLHHTCDWKGVLDIYRRGGFTIVTLDKIVAFAIPDRAFENENAADAFYRQMLGHWKSANPEAAKKDVDDGQDKTAAA